MTRFPFERAAYNSEPCPSDLGGAERILYHGLAMLYERLKRGEISVDEGKQEKAKLIQFYEAAKFDCDLWEKTRKMWGALAAPAAEYRKNPELHNPPCDKIIRILYEGDFV